MDNGPSFIKSIDQRAVFGVWAALLRAAAHADIAIAKGQHRFELGEEIGTKLFFDDIPFVGRIITTGWTKGVYGGSWGGASWKDHC